MTLTPKKAICTKGKSAWWYEERGSIGIYIEGFGTVLSCRIRRSALKSYLRRSEAKIRAAVRKG
jgi:hypothetical protein